MIPEKKKQNFGVLWVFIILLILAAAALLLLPVWRDLRRRQEEQMTLQKQLAALKTERNKGRMEIQALKNSPEAVEKVAREKYRLVRKGETVMMVAPEQKSSKKVIK